MDWDANLPMKRMSAGALFLDAQGHLLLVNPTYKPQWEIPGGIVEANESPREGCIREVQEEVGLSIAPDRLLSVGYQRSRDGRFDGVHFIFWGGLLDADTIARIRLPLDELSEFGFFPLHEAQQRLTPFLGERVRRSLAVVGTERTLYFEL